MLKPFTGNIGDPTRKIDFLIILGAYRRVPKTYERPLQRTRHRFDVETTLFGRQRNDVVCLLGV